MGEQLHIRDAETVLRIRRISRARGISMKDVVAEAVQLLDAGSGRDQFDNLLLADRAKVRANAGGHDALYDPESGMPQ